MFIQHLDRRLSFILLVVLLKTAAGQADSCNAAQTQSDQTKIELRGKVVDHAGAAFPYVTVEVYVVPPVSSAARPAATSPELTAQVTREGQFAVSVAPGSYQVCVARLRTSCRAVVAEGQSSKPDYLRLEVHASDDPATSDLLENRVRQIAGPGAESCGRVQTGGNRSRATRCARSAIERNKAFYVVYDDFDSGSAEAMASDSSGIVYAVKFGSLGIIWDWMPPGATMPDGIHTRVMPCSRPVRVRVSRGRLTCFVNDRWAGGPN